MARVHIGTSGYVYKHWMNGVFYPPSLPASRWLEFYAERFDCLELNNSFYRLPSAENFARWRARTPDNFLYAVKGSRFATHMKRLKDGNQTVPLFFSRAKHLQKKLNIVLWQLPPRFKKNVDRLAAFAKELRPFKARQCFEFRDATWFSDDVFRLLADENIAICQADGAFEQPAPDTADFIYVRRHGSRDPKAHTGSYTPAQIAADAERIRRWLKQKKDVFIFYNNDPGGAAIRDAVSLKNLLEI